MTGSPIDAATRDADAVRYCEDCGAWTEHDMDADGSYYCRLC